MTYRVAMLFMCITSLMMLVALIARRDALAAGLVVATAVWGLAAAVSDQ